MTSHGYRLAEAVAGCDGLAKAGTLRPDLIILDLGLPDIDGLHVIEQVREWASTPIVVLSASCQEDAKIAALDAGAGQKLSEPIITIGELRMDLARRQVARGDVTVHLTPTEYRLLIALAQHAGKVHTQP